MDVVSEGIDDRGEVCGKDPGVKVKKVLKDVHVGSLHKVLPVLQFGQQTILLSQPERPSVKGTVVKIKMGSIHFGMRKDYLQTKRYFFIAIS